jgi:glycosyltransferase involved in cell wall biosynthesis
MKVALVHDWLTGMRGGEKVLEVVCELYPDADIHTLFHWRGTVSEAIERHRIHTSFLQYMPLARTHYRRYLPLFPFAVERFDLDSYDFVLSSSHCVAKSVVKPGRSKHLCYCFSPMRYAWDQFDAYFGPAQVGATASRWLYRPLLARLARWDAATAHRVDRFVAISEHVADRIRRYYNRAAAIVYPPVDTVFYRPADVPAESHVLIVSAFVPYKRIDLAIAACQQIGVPLRIVGDGPDLRRLRSMAGAGVTFLGAVSDEQLRDQYRRARALVMPGEEDFGIAPVEAQACGRPVVALARGGVLETVTDGETGVLFAEATAESLASALKRLDTVSFDAERIRANAERFSRERHIAAMQAVIDDTLAAPVGTRW